MLPPSTSLPVSGKIAGVNTASLSRYLHTSKTRTRWVEGFNDELNSHVFDLDRDGLCQMVLCPWETSNHTIPDWSLPGVIKDTLSVIHQDRGVKHATGVSSIIFGRDNITIGIWNTRTLRLKRKLQEEWINLSFLHLHLSLTAGVVGDMCCHSQFLHLNPKHCFWVEWIKVYTVFFAWSIT